MSTRLTEDQILAADAIFSVEAMKNLVRHVAREQRPLLETFCLALAFHVVLFPVIWCIGWALPWPKSPVIRTVIEIDLQAWFKHGKPGKLTDIRDPELNK